MAYRKRYARKRRFASRTKRRYRKRSTHKRRRRAIRPELKTQQFRRTDYSIPTVSSNEFNNGVSVVSPGVNDISQIVFEQGVGQGHRIGNRIEVKSAYLNLQIKQAHLFDATFNYNPVPLYVTAWVVSIKPGHSDTLDNLYAIIVNSFFQAGNQSTGFIGRLGDLTMVPNKDMVTVHNKRTFKLGFAQYVSGWGTNAPNNVSQQWANNDFGLTKLIRMRLKFNRILRFNDGNNRPNMRNQYLFFTTARLDGELTTTGPNTDPETDYSLNGPKPITVNYNVTINYTDV